MSNSYNRRHFLQSSAAAGAAALAAGVPLVGADEAKPKKPDPKKLNIACIGVGGMGSGNHGGVMSENIVAICDVDEKILTKGGEKSPQAKRFQDFRKLLDECGKDLDAVVVSTPDHTHAVAAVQAMKMGLHCYCEKPLTHDVYEARVMRETAASNKAKGGGKIKTQMGNRGTAEGGFRRGVELLRAGVIGPVTEIHIWSNRPIWPQGMMERPKPEKVPEGLAWDVWLGPAPERPFAKGYHTFAWRGWWDFGTGSLGDMACHTANQAFMGLKLGAVKAVESMTKAESKESPPEQARITYEFGDRGEGFPACKLMWYDGTNKGKGNLPPADVLERIAGALGKDKEGKPKKPPFSGAMYIGEKGVMYAPDDYATKYYLSSKELEEAAGKVPETLPRFKGTHYQEWIAACKDEIPEAMSNFDYAGPLTEFVLLGNVAMRVGSRIEWDSKSLKASNPEAEQYVRRDYRKGWTL